MPKNALQSVLPKKLGDFERILEEMTEIHKKSRVSGLGSRVNALSF